MAAKTFRHNMAMLSLGLIHTLICSRPLVRGATQDYANLCRPYVEIFHRASIRITIVASERSIVAAAGAAPQAQHGCVNANMRQRSAHSHTGNTSSVFGANTTTDLSTLLNVLWRRKINPLATCENCVNETGAQMLVA